MRAEALKPKADGKGYEPSQWLKYIPCKGCSVGSAHAAAFDVRTPGHRRTMKRGRIDTVAVQLPPTIEEGEGEPEDKEGGIRYDQMKNGWFVRAWVVNQTITGGPFKTKKKAKRWISKRIAKVRRSAS